jgi:hypothetical protein
VSACQPPLAASTRAEVGEQFALSLELTSTSTREPFRQGVAEWSLFHVKPPASLAHARGRPRSQDFLRQVQTRLLAARDACGRTTSRVCRVSGTPGSYLPNQSRRGRADGIVGGGDATGVPSRALFHVKHGPKIALHMGSGRHLLLCDAVAPLRCARALGRSDRGSVFRSRYLTIDPNREESGTSNRTLFHVKRGTLGRQQRLFALLHNSLENPQEPSRSVAGEPR